MFKSVNNRLPITWYHTGLNWIFKLYILFYLQIKQRILIFNVYFIPFTNHQEHIPSRQPNINDLSHRHKFSFRRQK